MDGRLVCGFIREEDVIVPLDLLVESGNAILTFVDVAQLFQDLLERMDF